MFKPPLPARWHWSGWSNRKKFLVASITILAFFILTGFFTSSDIAYKPSSWSSSPAHRTLNGDLNILLNNNLKNYEDALLVDSRPQTHSSAIEACENLNEKLSNYNENKYRVLLAHLDVSSRKASSELYWIQRQSKCRAVGSNGKIEDVDCEQKLPVLCTHSAPTAQLPFPENTPKWQTTVVTGTKPITGYRDSRSFRFLGIPYADLTERFSYSRINTDKRPVKALQYGQPCIQREGGNPKGNVVGDEDCFFLNVWTPYVPENHLDSSNKLKPVMVWIHGGGFVFNSGGNPLFDGGNLASRGDVVVVTINYRLGAFGFLVLDDGLTNGNFGLGDQVVALEWVQKNIRYFGGDPDNVTLFGQSAGSSSVKALLASPKARGYFHRAIMQSGPNGKGASAQYSNYMEVSEATKSYSTDLIKQTGCTGAKSILDCLRQVNTLDLVGLSNYARYLVVDGTYIIHNSLPLKGKETHLLSSVPIMIGGLTDDAGPFIPPPGDDYTALGKSLDAAHLPSQKILKHLKEEDPEAAKSKDKKKNFKLVSRLATLARWECLNLALANEAVKTSAFPAVYVYEFERTYKKIPALCEAPVDDKHAVGNPTKGLNCHLAETPFVFGNLDYLSYKVRDKWDLPMARNVVDAWTSFARTGDPNPDREWLRRRGYDYEEGLVEGNWHKATQHLTERRVFKAPGMKMQGFGEGKDSQICEVMGLGKDFYDTQDE